MNYALVSDKCVNSRWPAKWLAGDREYCQCMCSCKVQVQTPDGYKFVVTEQEYKDMQFTEQEKQEIALDHVMGEVQEQERAEREEEYAE